MEDTEFFRMQPTPDVQTNDAVSNVTSVWFFKVDFHMLIYPVKRWRTDSPEKEVIQIL